MRIVKDFVTHGDLSKFGGYLVHTTGDGIPKGFIDSKKKDLLSYAVGVYEKMGDVGPHYIISPDGEVAQVRNETKIAWHAGVSGYEREMFLTGNWETDGRTAKEVVKWWKRKHAGVKSPSHLYPAKSPNQDFIGVEMIPAGTYTKNDWEPTLSEGAQLFGRFTIHQYMSLALLSLSAIPTRIVGHEDVNPITRPGWDPGDKTGSWNWNQFFELRNAILKQKVWGAL